MASLDPEKWFALDDPGREFAALNVRDHYKDLTAAQRGSGLAPQAREARNRLDDLELIIRSLGRCSSSEDAEDVLQKLAERAVGRLQVLQRGVVQGDWESAEVLERALTVDDEVPLFMARAEEKAHAHARKQRFRPPQTHEPPQHHQTHNRPHTQQTRHTPPGRHRKPGGDSRKSGAKAQ